MRRYAIAIAIAMSASLAGASAHAKPSQAGRTCTNSQTMKIPLRDLNRCALGDGVMKCTPGGYECCYDGGTVCEWMPYPTRPYAGTDLTPPPGGYALPPGRGRPDFRPPAGPYSPPVTQPPRGPRFDVGAGPRMVAPPPRPMGPRVK